MPIHSFASTTGLDTLANNARSIMQGLEEFIGRHTGESAPDGSGAICLNTSDIILNNMHYEVALSGYMPNGTATTEGQSILINGYIEAYKATKEPFFLAQAERFWTAYVKQFYKDNMFIPEKPQIWRCHWAINGKAPFITHGPVNYASPSQSGAWDIPVIFDNGVGMLPRGAPYYCEKLARLYFVYDGLALWGSVTSEPEDGGFRVPFAYFVDDRGLRLDASGDDVSPTKGVPTGEPTGLVKLKGDHATYTGSLMTQFSCRTGHVIARNGAFEGWPMWTHVDKSEYGNSADSELWFCEASYMLHELTGNRKYLRAFDSSLYTLWSSANLIDQNLLFAKTKLASTPFTEGISFWWNTTENADVQIGRDTEGYIHLEKTEEVFLEDTSLVGIEQSAMINHITADSYISMEYMNTCDWSRQPISRWNMELRVSDAVENAAPVKYYRCPVLPTNSEMTKAPFPVRNFVSSTKTNGDEFVMITGKSFVEFGVTATQGQFTYGILGEEGRNDFTGLMRVEDSSSGVVIGFWGATPNTRGIEALTYRYVTAPGQMLMTFRDADNWKWQAVMPGGGGEWVKTNFTREMFTLSPNQAVGGPALPPVGVQLKQIQLELVGEIPSAVELYMYGDELPHFFTGEGYMKHFKLLIADHYEFVAKFGDIEVMNTLPLVAKYTPGLIPFSTNYSRTKGQREYWIGTPNTGYQYPAVWFLGGQMEGVDNTIDYFYDAQQAFFDKKGVWGPMAPIFIWPRYDNLIYGDEINTFTYWDWGDHLPWGGYYSRAFYSMCRTYELYRERGLAIPWKLETCLQRYCTYLADFMHNNGGLTPTVFPVNGLPFNDGYDPDPEISSPDHTSHMTGHWLSGTVKLAMNGFQHPDLDWMIEGHATEFFNTYVVEHGKYQDMSGCYSAWVGGGYYYGFHTGEILRGMAHLIKYRDWVNMQPITDPVDMSVGIGMEEDGNFVILTEQGEELRFDNPILPEQTASPIMLEDSDTDSLATEEDVLTTIGLEIEGEY